MGLGEKRGNSIFEKEKPVAAHTAPKVTVEMKIDTVEVEADTVEAVQEIAEETTLNVRADELMTAEKENAVPVELGMKKNAHSLFFAPESEGKDFSTVLKSVQEYISENYAQLITDSTLEDAKEQMKRYISQFVMEKRIAVKGMNGNALIEALYTEMAEYGFLTKYIFGKGIEEIDINSWQDIEVQYSDGRTVKLDERFDSPEHAINVVRRMLHVSGMVLDNASPVVLGHLSKNIRIAAMKTPIVDEDVGVSASIRIVNPQSMKKEDFVNTGTATDKMLDFLSALIRYGISICVAGATSSGKTTVLGWLLTTIPDNKRIYTIENGSRELDLTRFQNGKATNSVIHTLTRDSDIQSQCIDQIKLLDMALRFNPDIAVVGEMRGEEANAAQEAARTGIAVMTTIHANSCEATYRRMVSLCKRAVDMSDETLMQYVTEAYPIIVFCKQLENKQRRMMEIMECEILPDGTRNYRTIFQYVITENRMEDGRFIIDGHHEQRNTISDSLSKRLLENGMSLAQINSLKEKDEVKSA
ncbi:MAG: CpaF/VirB11 family protein [Lachnospiraceae bacterium]|nr:CpaF/VirB11 family protein [Lachnospiraceae bacterium]